MTNLIKEAVLKDPSASYWLQNAIKTLDARDPVDALNDVEFLLIFLKHKLGE